MESSDLIIAYEEEIGNPDLFAGRRKELDFLLDWSEKPVAKLSGALVLPARKRRGKTAPAQRFFKILYTQNNPGIIPVYFRVPDPPATFEAFTFDYFMNLITHLIGVGCVCHAMMVADHDDLTLLDTLERGMWR